VTLDIPRDMVAKLLATVGSHERNRPLSPLEVGAIATANNGKWKQLADLLELKDHSIIGRFASITTLEPELSSLIRWGAEKGALSFSVAAEIAKLSSALDRCAIAKAALEHALTKEEVRAIVQRGKRGGEAASGALDEILKTRPAVERYYLFMGQYDEKKISPDEARRRLLNALAHCGITRPLQLATVSGRFSVTLTENDCGLLKESRKTVENLEQMIEAPA